MERNYGFWKDILGRNEEEKEEVLAASWLGAWAVWKWRRCNAASVRYLKVSPFKGMFGYFFFFFYGGMFGYYYYVVLFFF